MALGRRVCGPRDVVLVTDPTVDMERSDLEKYKDSLFDYKAHLKFFPGEKPTIFKVTPLTRKQKRVIQAYRENIYEFTEMVVRCGLVSVSNFEIISADGSITHPSSAERKDRGFLGECLSETWIDEIDLLTVDMDALACIILDISEARPLSLRPSGKQPGATKSSEEEKPEQG